MFAKVPGRYVFLSVVAALYAALAIYDHYIFSTALSKLVYLLLKIMPILTVVFVAMSLLNLFFRPSKVNNLLGRDSGLKGWIITLAGGMLSAGPIYLWYSLLQDLREKGMRDSLIVAFLYARAIKIPLIPVMVYYFGWTFTVMLCLYLAIVSVLSGLVVERLEMKG